MATLCFVALILLVTLGNLLLGFGTAMYFGHGPKWTFSQAVTLGKAWFHR